MRVCRRIHNFQTQYVIRIGIDAAAAIAKKNVDRVVRRGTRWTVVATSGSRAARVGRLDHTFDGKKKASKTSVCEIPCADDPKLLLGTPVNPTLVTASKPTFQSEDQFV